LTDVVMPRMGGGELVPRILEARPAIRVLYVSGYPDDAVVRHGLLDDQAAFLAKPFTLPALAARVRETLDGPPHRERVGEKLPAA
jgi:CheY-like chemotaxis protein